MGLSIAALRAVAKRGLDPSWGGQYTAKVVFYRIATGFYRLSTDFYRIVTGFYRLVAGFYRLWTDFSRVFPHLPAFSRINFSLSVNEQGNQERMKAGTAKRSLEVLPDGHHGEDGKWRWRSFGVVECWAGSGGNGTCTRVLN